MKYPLIIFVFLVLFVSCKRKWTDKDRAEFISGCMGNASRDSLIGTRFAKTYCQCLARRIEEKFPNANDVKYIMYDTATRQIGALCLAALSADSLQLSQ